MPFIAKGSGGGADGGGNYGVSFTQGDLMRQFGFTTYTGTLGTYTDEFGRQVTVNIVDVSTPFLFTWNGERFVHENDFLFGKPNTAFANYKTGLRAYEAGIGGDTYLLNNELKADADGNLKLQIRELEPEESYIDKFELNALDLKENEHFISDGNLEDSYIFDTEEAKVLEGKIYHYHAKEGVFGIAKNAYNSLAPQSGESITMQSDDELIIRVPKAHLNQDQDTFILIDSHYRDWTLGDQVPFSRLERFAIASLALGRSATTLAGAALIAITALGITASDDHFLKRLLSVPYTYADIPTSGGGGGGGRSLVISAGDSTFQTYLQTLFPRYVQASQEVVRIPNTILSQLKDAYLTVRVKATKKHKVRATFLFQGTPKTPRPTPLTLTEALHHRTNTDHAANLKEKNHNFLHTIPGDTVTLTLKDIPLIPNTTRRYVLKTNGFYTRLSPSTYVSLGRDWLDRLLPEDRKLLRRLRLS